MLGKKVQVVLLYIRVQCCEARRCYKVGSPDDVAKVWELSWTRTVSATFGMTRVSENSNLNLIIQSLRSNKYKTRAFTQ